MMMERPQRCTKPLVQRRRHKPGCPLRTKPGYSSPYPTTRMLSSPFFFFLRRTFLSVCCHCFPSSAFSCPSPNNAQSQLTRAAKNSWVPFSGLLAVLAWWWYQVQRREKCLPAPPYYPKNQNQPSAEEFIPSKINDWPKSYHYYTLRPPFLTFYCLIIPEEQSQKDSINELSMMRATHNMHIMFFFPYLIIENRLSPYTIHETRLLLKISQSSSAIITSIHIDLTTNPLTPDFITF